MTAVDLAYDVDEQAPVHSFDTKFKFDEQFETRIFAATVASPSFVEELSDVLRPEFFGGPIAPVIVKLVLHLHRKHKMRPSQATLAQETVELAKREGWNGDLFRETLAAIGRAFHLAHHIELSGELGYLKEKVVVFARTQALRLAIIESAQRINDCERKGNDEGMQGVADVIRKALTVGPRPTTLDIIQFLGDPISLSDADPLSNRDRRVPTGIPSIDRHFDGGPGAGEVAIFLGPSNVGKSMALVNIAASAIRSGKQVAFVSTELKPAAFGSRLISNLTNIPPALFGSPDYAGAVESFLRVFPNRSCKAVYFPPSQATVLQLRGWLAGLAARDDFVPDIVVLDYIDELRSGVTGSTEENTFYAQSQVMADLIDLAVENRCPLWTATQTTREGYKSDPKTHMTGRSIAKVEKADFIIAMAQTDEELSTGRMRYILSKVRRGTGKGQQIVMQTYYDRSIIEEVPTAASLSLVKD